MECNLLPQKIDFSLKYYQHSNQGDKEEWLPAQVIRYGPGKENIKQGGPRIEPPLDQLYVIHSALDCKKEKSFLYHFE